MAALQKYLERLKAQEEDVPIEPDLKPERQKQDKKIREEQDLASGAVMQAVVAEGEEGGASPADGDLVYIHYSVKPAAGGPVLFSTRKEEGGSGHPFALLLGRGRRGPRSWELALMTMTRGERRHLRVSAAYGYAHPDCRLAPPKGVPDRKAPLSFDLTLVGWAPAAGVRPAGDDDALVKAVKVESERWEMARSPNEVTFTLRASTVGSDGEMGGGAVYYAPSAELTVPLGARALPDGVEAALATMAAGERSVFVLPAAMMAPPPASAGGASSTSSSSSSSVPPPPAGAEQVELEVELRALVQVRDMTGDGGVLKRRVRQGTGEFPVDCPLNDTTVRLHFRARAARPAGAPDDGVWAYDSCRRAAAAAADANGSGQPAAAPDATTTTTTTAAAADGAAPPLEFDTGCGEQPEAVELCARLMVPGEVARATALPRYAYQGRADAPPGIPAGAPAEFEIELVGFDREGHWGHLAWPERWALLERLKAKGNALYRGGAFKYAANRYQRMLQLVDSTRDFDDEATADRADAYKLAALGNLALCEMGLGEGARAAEWCDKGLKLEPASGKLLLRKAKALSLKGDCEEADALLTEAAAADPALAAEAERERAANRARLRAAEAKQRRGFGGFFKAPAAAAAAAPKAVVVAAAGRGSSS